MMRKITASAVVLVLMAAVAGCMGPGGYYDPGASAAGGMWGGAATGAALGAIIGAATGNPGAGAWIGAASGALVGAVGGASYAHQANIARSSQASAQGRGYRPDMGNIVAIDQADATPSRVRPGSPVVLTVAYTILTPNNAVVPVELVREMRLNGHMVDEPYLERVNRQNGSYVDRVAYHFPANAAPGRYTATFRVLSPVGATERTVSFMVE